MGKNTGGKNKKRNYNDSCANSMEQSQERHQAMRKKMKVTQMERALDRELKALKALRAVPGKPTGKEQLPRPLVAEGCYTWDEAKAYLEARLGVAVALLDMEKSEDACRHYNALVQMDLEDHLKVKPILLRTLLDLGALENAKEFLDANPAAVDSANATQFTWSKAVLEYILWQVLEDDEGSEEKARNSWEAAYKANPHVATVLAWNETFVEEILAWPNLIEKLPKENMPVKGIEEALTFCHKGGLEVWMDAEGALEWSSTLLSEMDEAEREKVELFEGCCGDPMWLEMYEAAVEKAAAALSDGNEEN